MKCIICGNDVEHQYAICKNCGWENSPFHEDDENGTYCNGSLTLREAKKQWKENHKLNFAKSVAK